MRASLDTNAIIHFYKAGLQEILFHFFDEGVFIYEQIRNIELANHGQEVLNKIDADILSGKIIVYTDSQLKEQYEDDIMPFTFAEVLILRYLSGNENAEHTINDFNAINTASFMNWSFTSHISKFRRRFWETPYREKDTMWIQDFTNKSINDIENDLTCLENYI